MKIDREKFKAYVENWSFSHHGSALVDRGHREDCLALLGELEECETEALRDFVSFNKILERVLSQCRQLQMILSRLEPLVKSTLRKSLDGKGPSSE